MPPSFNTRGRRLLFCDRRQQILNLGLKVHLRKTLLAIDSTMHLYTGSCTPAISLIATRRGISRRSVQNHLEKLVKLELLGVYRCFHHNRRQTTNRYVLKYLNVHSAQEAARRNSPKSFTPLKVNPKSYNDTEKNNLRREYLSFKLREKRDRRYAGEMDSSRFRAQMDRAWTLTATFLSTPRPERALLAYKYMKEAQKCDDYRQACKRLRLNWEARRGSYKKTSAPRRATRSTFQPIGDVTPEQGHWGVNAGRWRDPAAYAHLGEATTYTRDCHY